MGKLRWVGVFAAMTCVAAAAVNCSSLGNLVPIDGDASTPPSTTGGDASTTTPDGALPIVDASTPTPDADATVDAGCPAACSYCLDGECVIECAETGTCQVTDPPSQCPAGMPCRYECSGKSTCQEVPLACPPDAKCTINCTGLSSCASSIDAGNWVMTCPTTEPCDVTCTGLSSCGYAVLKCGAGACHVNCVQPRAVPPGSDIPDAAVNPELSFYSTCGSDPSCGQCRATTP